MSSFVTQLHGLYSVLTPSICTHLVYTWDSFHFCPSLSPPRQLFLTLARLGCCSVPVPCVGAFLFIQKLCTITSFLHWLHLVPMHPCHVTLAPVSHIRPFPPYRHVSHPAQALKPCSKGLSYDFPPWTCYAPLGHGRALLPLPGWHLNTLFILYGCRHTTWGCLLGGVGLMTTIKLWPILSPLCWDVGYMLSHNGWLELKFSGL